MSQGSADKLIDLVKKSDLVPPKKLRSFLETLAAKEADALNNQERIAELLIESELLTKWQADKLLAGKHRGFRLGKYKLLGQIGKGGMSQVYLGEHVLMERRVAIKVLPRQRVKDKSYLQRFQLEARAAARLDDPNIVRVFDIDNEGEVHYIIMEYVQGRDLHQTVSQDGPLPFNTAARFITQVATGLQHAHEMGLVHRDIKPANCLVDANQTVKLLDMGLAKLTDDETSLTLANDENVLGTADYLAPEQALNSHSADARADIYSLGCTLYFLLCGRPPFPDGTISERLLKHQVEEPVSILKARPDCPLSLVNICQRMMAKKPEGRPQTAGEVARLLNEWLADRGESTVGGSSSGSGVAAGSDGLGSGVGSGILSRFSTPTSGSGSGRAASSDTGKLYAASSVETDEDIGLAPIDDDEGDKRKQAKKASSSSGVLSDESGAKLGGSKAGKSSGKTGGKSSTGSAVRPISRPASGDADSEQASLSSPGTKRKPRSIFEEEYSPNTDDDPIARRAARAASSGGYDPLHPPGYVNPYTKTPVWVFFLVGAMVLAVIAAIVVSQA